jgi:hypothetical protein
MFRQALIGAALAAIMGGAAFAAPANEDQCFEQLQDVESAAFDTELSDGDRTKVDDLLDTLEAQCSASEFPQAGETLSAIHQILGN